jgi:hypothetical protein
MKSSTATAISFSVLAAAVSVLGASAAKAGPKGPIVLVLRGPTSDPATSEAAVRVEGELTAAGFRVKILPLNGTDTEGTLESAGRELSPVAAFAIFARVSEADGSAIAEIWVTDRVQQKTVIERAQLGHGNQNRESEILAVRAVELLKADLVELWGPPPASPQPPAASATEPPPPANAAPKNAREAVTPRAPEAAKRDEEAKESDEPPAPAKPRAAFASGLGIGLGAGMTESFGAVGEAWAPTALASFGWAGGFGVRATFSGFGPSLTLRADAGTAQIEQQFATLEVVEAFWPTAPVVPFVCAGGGALHVHVDGTGFGAYRGNSSDSWSVISSAGVGAGIPLFPQLSFVAQARGLLAWPTNAVQIASAEVGRIGGPALRLDAGLLGVFR